MSGGYSWVPTINAATGGGGTSDRTVCVAATTGNVTIATALVVGATVDNNVVLAEDDLVLVALQTTASENGVYRVTSGAPVRADGWDAASEFGRDRIVGVVGGRYWANTAHRCRNWISTVDVDAVYFDEIPPSGPHVLHFVDDFDYFESPNDADWNFSGGGTATAVADADSIGAIELATGVNACNLLATPAFPAGTLLMSGMPTRLRFEARLYQDQEWTGSVGGVTNFGLLIQSFGNPPDNGIYFTQRDPLGADWYVGIASGAARTENATGIALGGTYQLFTIDVIGGVASFFHNRTYLQDLSGANFPAAALTRGLEAQNLSGGGTRSVFLDRVELRMWRQR